jgi:hypothetical protein
MRELERQAWLCTHKECVPPIRKFLLPGDPDPPMCPLHGRTMKRQANMPYDAEKVARSGQPQVIDAPKPKRKRGKAA